MFKSKWLFAVLTVVLWPLPVQALIFDAVHNGGTPGFYFLPPLVEPTFLPGDFDPTLDPVVQIVDGFGNVVAEFTTDDALRIDDEGSAYVVNWHTRDFDLDTGTIYRIYVNVEGVPLGFADLVVVDSPQVARYVDTVEYVALVNGHNLPIKFAIQR